MRNIIFLLSILTLFFSCSNNTQSSSNQSSSNSASVNNAIIQAPINISTNNDGKINSIGFMAISTNMDFEKREFTRHAVGSNDILIEILYAGICHSDIHAVNGEHGEAAHPFVPGHEIAGRVVQVGSDVTKFQVGDLAGVGCMVNSCRECVNCLNNQEQYCLNGTVFTYGFEDRFHDNEITQGGYSDNIVVSENFAILIPDNAELNKVAPLLCAGVTTYSPIKVMNIKEGDKVGVAGFGGLGSMALQYAVKLGAEVTVFDITEDKRQDALNMGAFKYININNTSDLENINNTLDYIISTIPAKYDLNMYMNILKRNGTMCILGIPPHNDSPSLDITDLVIFNGSRKVFGSLIGGIKETQEMLDYSVANNIYPPVEIINADAQAISDAYNKVINGEVKFRYVIDMKTLND